jgi:hypothetical protein
VNVSQLWSLWKSGAAGQALASIQKELATVQQAGSSLLSTANSAGDPTGAEEALSQATKSLLADVGKAQAAGTPPSGGSLWNAALAKLQSAGGLYNTGTTAVESLDLAKAVSSLTQAGQDLTAGQNDLAQFSQISQ